MRYSIEPRDKIYVNCYEFLSFARNIGALSNKYSQKCLDSAKKSTTDAIETGSKKKSNLKQSKGISFKNRWWEWIKERHISPDKDNKSLMN